MTEPQPGPSQGQIGNLLHSVFRLGGTLLSVRDKLVRDLGLTSALWQVMNEVSLATAPLSAAEIARRVGLTRQAVQRTSNDLVAIGMVAFSDNPDDRRTHLIALTALGTEALATANDRQRAWLATFGDALGDGGLDKATDFARVAFLIAEAPPEGHSKVEPAEPMPTQASPSYPIPTCAPVRKSRAFEGVNDHILNLIKAGALKPGGKLGTSKNHSHLSA